MARIRDELLDCVIYLYPSLPDAQKGEGIGGSGFLASVATQGLKQNFYILYAVTNKHVITNGSTVIRLTTKDGQNDFMETTELDWTFHQNGDDLAACPISFDPKGYRFNHVNISSFVTKAVVDVSKIGPGDDVFAVGRFINHEGKQRNLPTARFGCIAQMPNEPILIDGFLQESFLVEARSIGGFSGSPVFWRVLPMQGPPYRPSMNVQIGPYLLGVEWGFINSWSPLCDATGRPLGHGPPWDRQVEVNSGMMAVVPAWKLAELLSEGQILKDRQQVEAEVIEAQARNGPPTATKSVARPNQDDNSSHQEDFTSLLNAAAKTRKRDGQTSPDETNGNSDDR